MKKEYDVQYWNDLKYKLKLEYPTLTTADLAWRHSSTEELLISIAERLGKSLKELQQKVEILNLSDVTAA